MSKILDTILSLKSDLKGDWESRLSDINIYDDVKPIYQKKWTTQFCNQVVAFIVLAYDNQSGWISIHKDRWDDKKHIASRLGMKVDDQRVIDIIENKNAAVNDVVGWFILSQVDWRWDTVIACFEYHSEMMRFARTKTNELVVVDEEEGGKKILGEVGIDKLSAGNLKKGSNIELAIHTRRKGEEILKEMQEQFVQLDTVLVKEGKRKITDATNIDSWEHFIKDLRGK